MYEDPSGGGAGPPADLSLVMVVANSAINRVVVSRIIERAGLKVTACEADAAGDLLRRKAPCVVVVEEGRGSDGQAALQPVAEARKSSAAGLALVVLLSRPDPASTGGRTGHAADAVVAMPITCDGLAPVVQRLVEEARRLASS